MARIFGRKAFARKDMSQVSAAAGTSDFGTPAVGIRRAPHGTGDFVVDTRPAAPGIELVLRTVQRRTALAATVLRGFGNRWERPMSDIFADMRKAEQKPSVRRQLKKQPEAETIRPKTNHQQER